MYVSLQFILHRSGDGVWIGMRNPNAPGHDDRTWKWIDDSPKTYTNWDKKTIRDDEPNDEGEACVFMKISDNGQWFDTSCKDKRQFICKRGIYQQLYP